MMNLAREEESVNVLPIFPMLEENNVRQGFVDAGQFARLLAAAKEKLAARVFAVRLDVGLAQRRTAGAESRAG